MIARLRDRPSKAFIVSIPVNIGTFFLLFIAFFLKKPIYLSYVFITQAVVLAFCLFLMIKRKVWNRLDGMLRYLKRTIKYAWPLIINQLLVAFVQNIGKIYAQNMLNSNDMTRIAFSQRITMIIQLGHASVIGYLVKHVFLSKEISISGKIAGLYFSGIGISSLLSVVALMLFNTYFPRSVEITDPIFYFLIVYTIFCCTTAFFELYINKMNKNIFTPISTSIGFIFFLLVVLLFPEDGIASITLGMMLSAFITMILMVFVVYFFKKKYSKENVFMIEFANQSYC